MKKIITLIVLIVGFVGQAKSDDKTYVVAGTSAALNGSSDWDISVVANKMTHVSGSIYYLIVRGLSLSSGTTYSFKCGEYNKDNKWDGLYAFPSSNYDWQVDETGTFDLIYILDSSKSTADEQVKVVPIENIYLSNNYDGLWDESATSVFSYDSGTKWTKDVSKNGSTDLFFRLYQKGSKNGESYHRVVAKNNDCDLTIAGTALSADYTTSGQSNSSYCWKVTCPDYNFSKFTITAEFDVTNREWKVSADAYISKTITQLDGYPTGYATFGSDANVDFSKAISATTGSFSAYKGKVQSDGRISYGEPITTLYGGEGALLVGDAGTYSIPVAASASADTENNDFKAIDSKRQLVYSANYYILTNKKADNNEGPLGFYRVNSNGSWCAANTAYLETTQSPWSARDYFPLEDETESVESIAAEQKSMDAPIYDLQGRCVTAPQKGLYIVNGKKIVINK